MSQVPSVEFNAEAKPQTKALGTPETQIESLKYACIHW